MNIFTEDVTFVGNVIFLNTPRQSPSKFKTTDATPKVTGLGTAICSGGVITITNFIGGVDGQHLRILGDGTTTIKHGTNIFTNISADKLLTANVIYSFTYIDSLKQWFESD